MDGQQDESWLRFVENPLAIQSVYSATPLLDKVRLLEIKLNEDGPAISLRLTLNSFPENPPQKWTDNKFNRVQLTLLLIGILDLELRGWSTNNIGTASLSKLDNGIRFLFKAIDTHVNVVAEFVRIDKVSAYRVSETDG
jgi:hypothetical protein